MMRNTTALAAMGLLFAGLAVASAPYKSWQGQASLFHSWYGHSYYYTTGDDDDDDFTTTTGGSGGGKAEDCSGCSQTGGLGGSAGLILALGAVARRRRRS
ncbi:MAG: hypothetical protein KC621_05395 [Myxococcales bacterium]|nr:hypothetical protein [Myxococcales bacterium]